MDKRAIVSVLMNMMWLLCFVQWMFYDIVFGEVVFKFYVVLMFVVTAVATISIGYGYDPPLDIDSVNERHVFYSMMNFFYAGCMFYSGESNWATAHLISSMFFAFFLFYHHTRTDKTEER